MEDSQNSSQPIFPGPWHGRAAKESQELLAELYDGVKSIHQLKCCLTNVTIVAIVGPQKVGKSFLLGQLLMDADVARKESHVEYRTEEIPCLKWADGVLLLDSPGLTSACARMARMYFHGTHLLSSVHVYMRLSAANPENFDCEAVFDILFKSHLDSPPVLICLNKFKSNLVDGYGQYPSVDDLKKQRDGFHKKLESMVKTKAKDMGMAGFWTWNGFDAKFVKKWEKVQIVFSDLGLHDMSKEAPEHIKDFCREHVYGARQIAEWLQRIINPAKDNEALDDAVKLIKREWFQRDYEASRQSS